MTNLIHQPAPDADAGFERVERFQSLQTGQYWQALQPFPELAIDAGEVLLLVSIRVVDDKPHTIVLRPHPDKFGVPVEIEREEDGKKRKSTWSFEEYRFLLTDFLDNFAHEPNAAAVRAREVQEVQGRIASLQQELAALQASPQAMGARVGALLASSDEDGEKPAAIAGPGMADASSAGTSLVEGSAVWLDEATQGVVALSAGTLGDAIGSGLSQQDVSRMRVAAERQHQIAAARAEVIQAQTTAISETIQSLTPYYLEQGAAAMAQTEDAQTYLAKIISGIASLDLFVGKNVEVVTIKKGVSAPPSEPLTFAQRKLFMDEELAIHVDVEAHFDFQSADVFLKALASEPALVAQIFPTQRCALVMAVTRRDIEYGNAWVNKAANDENKRVFLLVRDGENLHQVFSPVTSHIGAARLFPTKGEQGDIFRGWDGSKVRFEDVNFTDKKAAHDAMALHYKRFLILACGLDHRLNLFGHFYPGKKTFDFVSMAFQEAHCRFLYDDEPALAEDSRPPFNKWLSAMNGHLRSGSRVLCSWPDAMNPDTAPGACKAFARSDERHFDRRYEAVEQFGMRIAYKDGKDLCVDVEVKGRTLGGTKKSFTSKVALTRYRAGYFKSLDDIGVPFLVLDAVEPEALAFYIRNRESRKFHLSFVRFFKRAIQHLAAERAAEADTRARLAQALLDGRLIDDPAAAAELVDDAVRTWRASNRGAPLPAFDGDRPPAAWTALLDQMFARAKEDASVVDQASALASKLSVDPLRLVITGRGRYALYAAPALKDRDDRLEPHAWVHRLTLERSPRGLREAGRRWVLLKDTDAGEIAQHEWPTARTWTEARSSFKNLAHKGECLSRCESFKDTLAPYLGGPNADSFRSLFATWQSMRLEMAKTTRLVVQPEILIPIGLLTTKDHHARFVCIGANEPHLALQGKAADRKQEAALRDAYISPFADKAFGAADYDRPRSTHPWTLMTCDLDLEASPGGFDPQMAASREFHGSNEHLLLQPLFEEWIAERQVSGGHVWIAPQAMDDDGHLALDGLLGLKLPDDYNPCYLRSYSFTVEGGTLPRLAWDIIPVDGMPVDHRTKGRAFPDVSKEGDEQLQAPFANIARNFSQGRLFTLAAARKVVAAAARGAGGAAVPSEDRPQLPQPPSWAERWYFTD